MKQNPLQELWRDTVPPEVPCPEANAEAVLRRVNAVLDAVPSERKRPMGQKIRFAAVFAAVTVLLAGAALGVAAHWDVLNAFFQGDTSPAEELVDREVRAVSDKDYTLTVESSVSDGETAYLVARVEARNEAAVAVLHTEDFFNMDTFVVCPVADPSDPVPEDHFSIYQSDDNSIHTRMSLEMHLEEIGEAATETSRTWRILAALEPEDHYLKVRLACMDPDLIVTVPLSPAESVTVEIGATGQGAPRLYNLEGGTVRMDAMTLSPFGCRAEIWRESPEAEVEPLFFFLTKEGTFLTMGQTTARLSSYWYHEDGTGSCLYRFQQVLDLSQLEAVVFDGMAYPLDGGAPYAVEVDPKLYPFQLPLMDRLSEDSGYSLSVQALCEALGAGYSWNQETQTAVCTYRGTTVSLTVGSTAALVNGQEVTLEDAPALQAGVLASGFQVFGDAWGLDSFCPFNEDRTERVCWVILP